MSSKLSVLSCKSNNKPVTSDSGRRGTAFSRVGCLHAGANLCNQSGQHQFDFANSAFRGFVLLRRDEAEVASKQTEIVEFAGGAQSQVKELPEFSVPGSTASLRDVSGYREGSSSHLAGQSESFIRRKWSRRSINSEGQIVAFSPDIQFSEVLHGAIPPKHLRYVIDYWRVVLSVLTYHLKLITYNSEESYSQC